MPLQTDPTVIYGLGERFDGNLRKRDLLTDGAVQHLHCAPGLPPTPIAMPGAGLAARRGEAGADARAVLRAARRRQRASSANRSSDHNRAVDQYQRRRACAESAEASSGRFITLRGHRRRRQVHAHRARWPSWLRGAATMWSRRASRAARELAETLRELVLHAPMDALTEALLVFAARRDHLQQLHRAGAGARCHGAVRPLHRRHLRLPGRAAAAFDAEVLRALEAGCSRARAARPHTVVRRSLRRWPRSAGGGARARSLRATATPPSSSACAPAMRARCARRRRSASCASMPRSRATPCWRRKSKRRWRRAAGETGARDGDRSLPWLAAPLEQRMAQRACHALLVHGPAGVGQFELALALAARLAVRSSSSVPARPSAWPAAAARACRLIAARTASRPAACSCPRRCAGPGLDRRRRRGGGEGATKREAEQGDQGRGAAPGDRLRRSRRRPVAGRAAPRWS